VPVANIAPSALTDTFTQSRAGGARVHNAIDIMAPTGTPVIAAIAGTVEKLFLSDEGGKVIYIRSPDKQTITYYAHLNAYAPSLREGDRVRQGQVLGTVGYTGNASPEAPHLHFAVMRTSPDKEWYEPSESLNPYPLLTAH
jgi:murein DD-endopeptidase MepM/ murein hydrolase activator NlpD